MGVATAVIATSGAVGLDFIGARAGSARVLASNAALTPLPQVNSAIKGGALDLQTVAAQVDPAVVDINTVFQSAGGSGRAAGTGVILTSSGEVLSNNHVVDGATNITVQVQGRSESYTARVLGVDPTADVALIQLEGATGLPTASLADSSTAKTGEPVAAIGNAGGVGGAPSVSSGLIVALDQSITAAGGSAPEHLTGMIESNATIAPGDSGGPLVNSAGQVIGMTTAGQSSSRRGTSLVGFAVPTNVALSVINQVRAGQASPQVILGQVGYLGVSVTDLPAKIVSRLGLNAASGALVTGVINGSPAALAGVGRYAVITGVAGTPIASTADLGTALHAHKPGDQVQLTWLDPSGATHTATISLTTGPAI